MVGVFGVLIAVAILFVGFKVIGMITRGIIKLVVIGGVLVSVVVLLNVTGIGFW